MADSWFSLNQKDQREVLEIATAYTLRPAHLLEKDIWVVWVLSAIYQSDLSSKLTFKGGTSLSKVYKIINRFSEDVDLTYDIRELVPDLLKQNNPIPTTSSQEKKISSAVRERLPIWIDTQVKPIIEAAWQEAGLVSTNIKLQHEGNDKLILYYPQVKTGTGYSAPSIQLEFGARATGEPNYSHAVTCDLASVPVLKDIIFPDAKPLVMNAERTFWEKATAVHVYCLQGRLRGHRYSRHWYDLVAIANTPYFDAACTNKILARGVAEHKSMFFPEKDTAGKIIDYYAAVNGYLQLVPTGESLNALKKDYTAMLQDGLLLEDKPPSFDELIEKCHTIQNKIN